MRRAGILIALLLLVTACNGKFVRANTTAPPPTTKSVGSALGAGLPTTPIPSAGSAKTAAAKTSFTLTVTDRRGVRPPGIPVRISGAMNGTQLTDAGGRIKVTKPGVYHFTISPGCGGALKILSGATGTAGVVAGQSSTGDLTVDWQRRYVPNAPMFSNPSPPWPIGGNVTLSYTVIDRCGNAFAPNVAFTPLVFTASSNLRVVGTPVMHSDGKHMATVVIECLYKGDVKLVASDKYNPKDSFDLILDSTDYEQPRCG